MSEVPTNALQFVSIPDHLGNLMQHAANGLKIMKIVGSFCDEIGKLDQEYAVRMMKVCANKKKEIQKMVKYSKVYVKQMPYTVWMTFFDQMTKVGLNSHSILGKNIGNLALDVKKDVRKHEREFNLIKDKLQIAKPFEEARNNIHNSKIKAMKALSNFMKAKEDEAMNRKKGKQSKKAWIKRFTKATELIQKYKFDLREGNEIANDFHSQIIPTLHDLQREEIARQTTLKSHLRRWTTIHQNVIQKYKEVDIYNELSQLESDFSPEHAIENLIRLCQTNPRFTTYTYKPPNYINMPKNEIEVMRDNRSSFIHRYDLHWFEYELTTPNEFWAATQQLSPFPKDKKKGFGKFELFNCTLEEVIDFQVYYSSTLAEMCDTPLILSTISKEIKGHAKKVLLSTDISEWERQWYREQLESGNYRCMAPSPEVAASVLFMWLEELPEPLIPIPLHNKCMRTLNIMNKEARQVLLKSVMQRVPPLNWTVINHLLDFTKEAIGIDLLLQDEEIKRGKKGNLNDHEINKRNSNGQLKAALSSLTLTKICERLVPFFFQKDDKFQDLVKWTMWLVEYSCGTSWNGSMGNKPFEYKRTTLSGSLHECTMEGCHKPRFINTLCAEHSNPEACEDSDSDESDDNHIHIKKRLPTFESNLNRPQGLKLESGPTSPKHVKRTKIREEIVKTEKSYVESLKLLHKYWIIPLKTEKTLKSLRISQEDAARLHSTLESIKKIQIQFLENLDRNPLQLVSTFNKYCSFFKIYCDYLKHYEDILSTMTRLQEKNKRFKVWFETQEAQLKEESEKILGTQEAFSSHLIKPVQRIPRYVLLLKELKKNTEPTHPSYVELNDALGNIQTVANEINLAKKKMENMTNLLQIQTKISNYQGETLMQPQRCFVREGDLIVPEGLGKTLSKATPRKVLLFSDLIIWTSNLYTYKGRISLLGASLSVLQNQDLQIVSTRDILYLRCNNKEDREEWLAEINKTIRKLRRARAREYTARNLTSSPTNSGLNSSSHFSHSGTRGSYLKISSYMNNLEPISSSPKSINTTTITTTTNVSVL